MLKFDYDLMKELAKVQAVWGEELSSKIENSVDEYIEMMQLLDEEEKVVNVKLVNALENLEKETKETSSNITGSMKLFADVGLNKNEKSKPKKLHIVEFKDGRVLDVPFGKLVIVIDTFAKKDLEKCLNRDDTVFVLGSDIRMIQNVEV